jgi:microcompartment protein CcmK/EutM
MQVEKTLVSTNRIKEMGHRPLLVVIDKPGGTPAVAVDAVGCIPGDWEYPSDLTIVGIIDHWEAQG